MVTLFLEAPGGTEVKVQVQERLLADLPRDPAVSSTCHSILHAPCAEGLSHAHILTHRWNMLALLCILELSRAVSMPNCHS